MMDYGAAEQTGLAFYGDDQEEDELQYEEENQPELYSGGGEDAEPPPLPIRSADDSAAREELKHSINDSSSSAGLVLSDIIPACQILTPVINIVIVINCYQVAF